MSAEEKPYIINDDGEIVPSYEKLPCEDCGEEMWVSSWPGVNVVCPSQYGGDLVCDACEENRDASFVSNR